jgi:hypothetical protein
MLSATERRDPPSDCVQVQKSNRKIVAFCSFPASLAKFSRTSQEKVMKQTRHGLSFLNAHISCADNLKSEC